MNYIKRILFKSLGTKAYLRLISRVYLNLISMGFMKKQHPEIHFLKKIIKKNYVCIDIGANLGYYSYFLSILAGPNGKLYAVEPVELFAEIWEKNLKKSKYDNFQIFRFALGEENKKIKMVIPVFNGVLHHGMTRIKEDDAGNIALEAIVEMKKPDTIFSELSSIDFIKIDVEGYEHVIIKNMQDIIKQHLPVIQAELSGEENRESVIKTLSGLNYEAYILSDNKLVKAGNHEINIHPRDFYFLPEGKNPAIV